MQLNYDIWHQVVNYLEPGFNEEDAPEKREVLLNLAVSSRMLSSLALPVLWKNTHSLHSVVDVINSFTPATEEIPLLTWVQEDDNKYWLLRRPGGDQINARVMDCLGWIHALCIWEENESERALWPLLIAWFWRSEPLLPNLRELTIYFMEPFANSYYHLAFMAPPTLKVISTTGAQKSEHLIAFYQLLHSRGCSPTEVEYLGDLRLPPTLTSFKDMTSLLVSGPYLLNKRRSSFSLPELLHQLPSLKFLEIDLDLLQIRVAKPLDPFEHLSLEELTLQASTEELNPFLSFDLTCPVVKIFSLKIRSDTNLSWNFFFTKAILIFPNLCDLTVEGVKLTGAFPLVLSDLAKLQPQPMESLILDSIPNKVSQKDLQQLLETWPKLNTLTLTGSKVPFDVEVLLSTFTHRNLHTLELPLNLIPLASPCTSPAQKAISLRYLYIAPPTRFPTTLEEKIMVAQNLLTLLPELETVEIDDKITEAGAKDLGNIINGMQAVVAARSNRE